jgi:hypothetical protein
MKYSKCSNECLILGIIYLDRITLLDQTILYNKYNIHRFLMISIVIAIKFIDDVFYTN